MYIFICTLFCSTVTGIVYDRDTHVPLQAHVSISDREYVNVCDSTGAFTFTGVSEENTLLIISHVGYKSDTIKLAPYPYRVPHLTVGLQSLPITLDSICVQAEKPPLPDSRKVTFDELRTIPGAEKDVFKALQTLPGVNSPSDFLGLLYVRGGELHENAVYYDGTEILHPYHFLGISTIFNTDMIGSFDFLAGAFPARYGGAVSSILAIQSKPHPRTISGALSIDLIEADWMYHCPVNKVVSFTLSSRRNYLDVLLDNLGIVEDVIIPYYLDHQGNISIQSPLGRFIFSGFKNQEKTNITANIAGERINLEIDGSGQTINGIWEHAETKTIRSWGGYFHSEFTQHLFGEMPGASQTINHADEDMYTKKYGAFYHVQYESGLVKMETGGGTGTYVYRHAGPKAVDILYGINSLETEYDIDTSDIYAYFYANQRVAILSPFVCELGQRLEWFPLVKQPVFSPRIRLLYDGTPRIYLEYGLQYQTPPLEYVTLETKAYYSKTICWGIEHAIHPLIIGGIELYRKQYRHLMRDAGYYTAFDGSGYANGIEISLRKYNNHGSFGWVSYSFSASKRTSPYDAEIRTSNAHRPHILNLVYGKEFSNGYLITLKCQFATGAAFYDLVGVEWVLDRWLPVYAPEKSHLPQYQRIDVHFGKNIRVFGFTGEMYLTILNLTNHKNIQGYFYNSDYMVRKAIFMMPRIPLIGVRLTF